MDLNVDIVELYFAAGEARSAGRQAERVALGRALEGAGKAMPGSRSAYRVGSLEDAWTRRLGIWAAEMSELANDIRAAAKHYETHEASVARDFSTVAAHFSALGW